MAKSWVEMRNDLGVDGKIKKKELDYGVSFFFFFFFLCCCMGWWRLLCSSIFSMSRPQPQQLGAAAISAELSRELLCLVNNWWEKDRSEKWEHSRMTERRRGGGGGLCVRTALIWLTTKRARARALSMCMPRPNVLTPLFFFFFPLCVLFDIFLS